MVLRHAKGNPVPHPVGASVKISNSKGQGRTRKPFTLGKRKRALDFMNQRSK